MEETTSAPVETNEVPAENVTETVTEQPAPVSRKEKFKFKIDGEDSEEEIDLDDREGLTKRFQLAKAAEKRIAAANSDRKKAFEILKAFEDGSLLKKHPKARELAESLLLEQIQDEMRTPEEKKALTNEQRLKQYEEKEALENKTKADQLTKAQEDKLIAEFQTTIITALEKSGLPKTPALAKRMAAIMDKNLDLGLKLTPDELMAEVKSETLAMVKSIIGDADGDQLQALFGEDVAKKIRQSDVKKLKSMQNNIQTREKVQESPKSDSGRPLSMEEWKEQVAARIKD